MSNFVLVGMVEILPFVVLMTAGILSSLRIFYPDDRNIISFKIV